VALHLHTSEIPKKKNQNKNKNKKNLVRLASKQEPSLLLYCRFTTVSVALLLLYRNHCPARKQGAVQLVQCCALTNKV
jgi:hypothetical protein